MSNLIGKIEVGKTYLNRKGNKITIHRRNSQGDYVGKHEDEVNAGVYEVTGKYMYFGPHDFDLVSAVTHTYPEPYSYPKPYDGVVLQNDITVYRPLRFKR